ncbi:MAG: hypothetical protein AAGB11_05675 [Pseudomonadota bacterium]
MTRIKQLIAAALAVVGGILAIGIFGFIGFVVVGLVATLGVFGAIARAVRPASQTKAADRVIDAEVIN